MRLRESCIVVDDEVRGDTDVEADGCSAVDDRALASLDCKRASGMGVSATLCWSDCCTPGRDDSRALGTGGMYVWPYEGEKMGNGDAAERAFVRDVTVDSCGVRCC